MIYTGTFRSNQYTFFGFDMVYGDMVIVFPETFDINLLNVNTNTLNNTDLPDIKFDMKITYKGAYNSNKSMKFSFLRAETNASKLGLPTIRKYTYVGSNNSYQTLQLQKLFVENGRIHGEWKSSNPDDEGTFRLEHF